MNERAEIIDLGFYIADGENISYSHNGDKLIFKYTDWNGQNITIAFENVIGFKCQRATFEHLPGEAFDSVHIIHNSKWLQQHIDQGETWSGKTWHHYKLNFNAAGAMEVLCSNMAKI